MLIGATAVLLWFVWERSYLTGDSAWALIWGQEMAAGELPSFESAFAPRSHPFAAGLGFLLSPMGEHAAQTTIFALGYLALTSIVWAVFRTGQLAFSWAAGAFAAAAVATSYPFLSTTSVGSMDLIVVALVLSAAVLELRRERCGTPVLGLLALAGLQRPEVWLLSCAYFVYLIPGLDRAGLVRAGALAASAPVIWLASGLVVAGDPFFSFSETLQKDVVIRAGQEGNLAVAGSQSLQSLFDVFRAVLRLPMMLGAGLGIALAVLTARRRSAVPAALAVLGTAALALLAFKGVYLSARYALTPGAGFAVFCGFFAFGWVGEERRLMRRGWAVGAVLLAGLLLGSAPQHVNRIGDLSAENSSQRAVVNDLRALTRGQDVSSIAGRCGRLVTPNAAPVPYLSLFLDRPPDAFSTSAGSRPAVLLIARGKDTREFLLASGRGRIERQRLPAGSQEIAANRHWQLHRAGC